MIFIIKKFLNTLIVISNYSPFALIWMIKAFLYDWIARKRSFAKLPEAGLKIGLRHKESDHIKGFGELSGKVNGYRVIVKPDDHMESRISVHFLNSYKGLELSLRKPYLRPEKDISDYKTTDWKFNLIFKTKRSHKNIVSRLIDNYELHEVIISFYTKWIFKLDGLSISNDELICTLKYGFNFFPYIPVSKLVPVVSELVRIARTIDSVLGYSGNNKNK